MDTPSLGLLSFPVFLALALEFGGEDFAWTSGQRVAQRLSGVFHLCLTERLSR
jgi:hypothetical protein